MRSKEQIAVLHDLLNQINERLGIIGETTDAYFLCQCVEILKQQGATIDDQATRITELEAQLETERMRVAACGVVAMQNTEESKAERITKDNLYWTASYGDVCRAVDAEIALRAQLADAKQVANDCRIVADNAIAEAQAEKKDAAKWRLLMSGDILIPASERLPEHTIILMRATTDQFGGWISAVADEDEYFDELLADAAIQAEGNHDQIS